MRGDLAAILEALIIHPCEDLFLVPVDWTRRGYYDRAAYYRIANARPLLKLTPKKAAEKLLSTGMWRWYVE